MSEATPAHEPIPNETREWARQQRAAGLTWVKIAQQLGVGYDRLRRACEHPAANSLWTEERVARMLALREKGYSYDAIAREMGVHGSTVEKRFKRLHAGKAMTGNISAANRAAHERKEAAKTPRPCIRCRTVFRSLHPRAVHRICDPCSDEIARLG